MAGKGKQKLVPCDAGCGKNVRKSRMEGHLRTKHGVVKGDHEGRPHVENEGRPRGDHGGDHGGDHEGRPRGDHEGRPWGDHLEIDQNVVECEIVRTLTCLDCKKRDTKRRIKKQD